MYAFRFTAAFATLSLALGVSLSAHATSSVTIKVTGENKSPLEVSLSKPLLGGDVTASQLSLVTSSGQSFAAYCIELSQKTSNTFQTYSEGSFSGTQATQLQGLFSATSLYTGANKIDSSLEYAAFQVAVWEIVSETSAKRGVSLFDGSFYVTGLSKEDLGIAAKANTYLSDALAYKGPSLFNLYKLSNAKYQDLVVVTPSVPEVNGTTLMALGMGVVGVVVRRRKSR
jgi:hypothetical protein